MFSSGKDLFDYSVLNEKKTKAAHLYFMSRMKNSFVNATPTITHYFIKNVFDSGKLLRCYTQNIDCLEARVGLPLGGYAKDDKIIQLHGTSETVKCNLCKNETAWTMRANKKWATGIDNRCWKCEELHRGKRSSRSRGTKRPGVILYNEHHAYGAEIGEMQKADLKKVDLCFVIGTSIEVDGISDFVRDLSKVLKQRGGKLIYINQTEIQKPHWKTKIDYHFQGDCNVVCGELSRAMGRPVASLNWEEEGAGKLNVLL